ncbi:hypothetical protein [Devriesea agamarum]|uniref:hypothetical protein n=1 Tax=Devriesea agamarum TaxID=472569 RepID=UPI00071CE98A|nr:hypothetical protein [Devriesea agamarum]
MPAPDRKPVEVSPLTVPLIFVGLVVGFILGYVVGGFLSAILGVICLIGLLVLAFYRPSVREAAACGAGALILGYLGGMGIALLNLYS